MLKKKLIILFTFISSINFAQINNYSNYYWFEGTALVNIKENININFPQKSNYTLNNSLEININPFFFIVLPEIGIKYKWFERKNSYEKKYFKNLSIIFSTNHKIYYPTKILNISKSIEYLNYNPNPNDIKNFISFQNELLITFILKKKSLCNYSQAFITGSMGINNSIKNKTDYYSINKNSLIYLNTSMFDNKPVYYFAIQLDNKFKYNLFYKVKIKYSKISTIKIIDQNLLLYTNIGNKKKFRIGIGYNLAFSNNSSFGIMPIFTVGYNFSLKSNKNNLFNNGIMYNPEEERDMF